MHVDRTSSVSEASDDLHGLATTLSLALRGIRCTPIESELIQCPFKIYKGGIPILKMGHNPFPKLCPNWNIKC